MSIPSIQWSCSVSQHAKSVFSLSVTQNSSINTFFFSNAANPTIAHLPVNFIIVHKNTLSLFLKFSYINFSNHAGRNKTCRS